MVRIQFSRVNTCNIWNKFFFKILLNMCLPEHISNLHLKSEKDPRKLCQSYSWQPSIEQCCQIWYKFPINTLYILLLLPHPRPCKQEQVEAGDSLVPRQDQQVALKHPTALNVPETPQQTDNLHQEEKNAGEDSFCSHNTPRCHRTAGIIPWPW